MKIKNIVSAAAIMACGCSFGAFDSLAQKSSPMEQYSFGPGENDVMKIYCVTHGSVAFEIGGEFIYVDPTTEIGPGFYFFTHEHGDHLSKSTISYLKEQKGNDAVIFGTENCIAAIGKGRTMKNGDTVSIPVGGRELKVKAVPANNTSKGHENFHPLGRDNGYLFTVGSLTVYVAGDTEPIPSMAELGKVDVAFLPVNQPYTMTVEQCIEATKTIKPSVLIPYHLSDTDVTPIIDAFAGSATEVHFYKELK